MKLSAKEKERRRRERWERNFVFKPPKQEQTKQSGFRPRFRFRAMTVDRLCARYGFPLPEQKYVPAHWLRPLADARSEQQLRAWLEARRRHGYLPPVTHPEGEFATQ
jgi:hypothetical protein